jgi:hypothetical protein
MNEFDCRLESQPSDHTAEIDGVVVEFDAVELKDLAWGREVVREIGDARYYITAPVEWAVFFNGSRIPELQKFVASDPDRDALEAQAVAFRLQHVGAEYASRHEFLIMPVALLPAWVGKTYAAMAQRQRREKQDVCAWEHAQAF